MLKTPKNRVKICIFKGSFVKTKKSIFSIEKAHIFKLFVLNKLVNGQHLKCMFQIKSIPYWLCQIFILMLKTGQKMAYFQVDFKKKQSNFLPKFFLFLLGLLESLKILLRKKFVGKGEN